MAQAEQEINSDTVQDIVRRIQALAPEEQEQVRRLLDVPDPNATDQTSDDADERLRSRLRQRGLLGPASPSNNQPLDYSPIPIEGMSVSELLILERR